MAVFGAGAYYDEDVTMDFIERKCFCIGHEKEDASALYEMLRRIKIGDIVYLKSFNHGKKGESGKLFIKAIGFVVGQGIKSFTFPKSDDDMGYGREVMWVKKYVNREDWIEIELEPEERVNNVYANTLYEEYSARIIKKMIKLIIKK